MGLAVIVLENIGLGILAVFGICCLACCVLVGVDLG